MKPQKVLLVLLIFSALFQICLAQETPQAHLVDDFGKPCSEDLMARFDNPTKSKKTHFQCSTRNISLTT